MAVDDRSKTSDERVLDRRIDAAAWGVLLVWAGVALLANVGWGVGLVGVGVITLGAQVWRRFLGVKVDRFSVIVGALFAIVGIWNLFELRVDVVPLLFIAAGLGLLASTWRTRRAPRSGSGVDATAHRHG